MNAGIAPPAAEPALAEPPFLVHRPAGALASPLVFASPHSGRVYPPDMMAASALDEHFHVLLTDIVMPGIDGIEVARLAAARQPHLRIMFITGFAAVALTDGDRAPPGAKVLSKPVHLREIVAEVERMVAA